MSRGAPRSILLLSCTTAVLLAACAQKPVISPAVSLAQASAQRGAQAFARGELPGAQREYTTALRVYESLGDTPGRASTLLSLARIAAQAGKPAEALAAVDQVLADPALVDVPTRITAHGRAAALHLAQGNIPLTEKHLADAAALCAASCADAGAITVLRARAALAQQQPAIALRLASDALALPALALVTPATLKPQASAERANALRVQAQAQMALGAPALASSAALAALELDRALGLADRVLPDLQLLAQASRELGATDAAQRYQALAERAQAAGRALRSGTAAD
ncbi:MAG: tetratricopeptide repeat protein [Bdellovibrionales bacterium]|nr:tetratricopeptide repeat protein [Ramlibacter sp.]